MYRKPVLHRDLDLARDQRFKILEKFVCDVVPSFVYILIGDLFDAVRDAAYRTETDGDGIAAVRVFIAD